MRYFKYTHYVYLIAAVFAFYKGITTWNEDSDMHWLYVVIGVMALLMFYVRNRFIKNMNSGPKQ